jgi:hypothetical protein
LKINEKFERFSNAVPSGMTAVPTYPAPELKEKAESPERLSALK